MKTTGFIKRFLGTKKVEKKEDKLATELTLRVIETQIVQMKEFVLGMSGNLEKMARGMDSLSKYFEMQIEQMKKMEEIESRPPTEADYKY